MIRADEEEYVDFRVRLPLPTVAWLMELAGACKAPPSAVIVSLLEDVKSDDEAAHGFPAEALGTSSRLN